MSNSESIRKTAKKIIKDKKNWSPAERQYAKMIRKRLKSKDETVER